MRSHSSRWIVAVAMIGFGLFVVCGSAETLSAVQKKENIVKIAKKGPFVSNLHTQPSFGEDGNNAWDCHCFPRLDMSLYQLSSDEQKNVVALDPEHQYSFPVYKSSKSPYEVQTTLLGTTLVVFHLGKQPENLVPNELGRAYLSVMKGDALLRELNSEFKNAKMEMAGGKEIPLKACRCVWNANQAGVLDANGKKYQKGLFIDILQIQPQDNIQTTPSGSASGGLNAATHYLGRPRTPQPYRG
ncbi:hypothetical protein EX30DRAFT_350975 [Ascodesmis nigricans]|uniref:PEBP-like protein n=1 Tax=Ascodesmis nigricans TaxID=341454 RepID=A0A4V3SI38_9PEZI|nr:hypothetical protein EX30DRAFT_350975 [Ascodesmis nigricans]